MPLPLMRTVLPVWAPAGTSTAALQRPSQASDTRQGASTTPPKAATVIGTELAKTTGDNKYATCGTEVETKLNQTDAEVRDILSAVPADKRVLVTDHEAYNYFADAYDFEIAGVVIPGGSTDAEPSSQELANLVKVVQEDKVAAIFSNNTVNPRLVEAVANEAGTDLKVVQLFEGSVGPEGSGAETYAAMMLTNAQRIADALK